VTIPYALQLYAALLTMEVFLLRDLRHSYENGAKVANFCFDAEAGSLQ